MYICVFDFFVNGGNQTGFDSMLNAEAVHVL